MVRKDIILLLLLLCIFLLGPIAQLIAAYAGPVERARQIEKKSHCVPCYCVRASERECGSGVLLSHDNFWAMILGKTGKMDSYRMYEGGWTWTEVGQGACPMFASTANRIHPQSPRQSQDGGKFSKPHKSGNPSFLTRNSLTHPSPGPCYLLRRGWLIKSRDTANTCSC